ncbi:Glyoxalase-like domain protein [Anatilimnocola aggregata]|uniref:Glyoxalase-like domain protein n=1 Tax=Anatilimnocola aggregata TaxID=2528021 RepID=A0A517YLV0_9BACT|nr:VOC family protein [Anatilimnocola aggregata]QDU31196.1 Glyoxalase-like domain protein [Anatilimnocola aggregata]
MPAEPAKTTANIIPCLRYQDAHATIEWLCTAFGFQKRAVYADEQMVHHAELTFGNGMVMLGSNVESEFGKLTALAAEVGGRGTQSPYIIVADADAHHAQAIAHGAKVVIPLKTEDYGGRGYSCLDPEGNLWTFGTYDPWTVKPQG